MFFHSVWIARTPREARSSQNDESSVPYIDIALVSLAGGSGWATVGGCIGFAIGFADEGDVKMVGDGGALPGPMASGNMTIYTNPQTDTMTVKPMMPQRTNCRPFIRASSSVAPRMK